MQKHVKVNITDFGLHTIKKYYFCFTNALALA